MNRETKWTGGPMRCLVAVLVTLAIIGAGGTVSWQIARADQSSIDATPRTYKLVNGQWFDGREFRRDTLYTVDGTLTHKEPAKIDEVIDLGNGYVIPPFGEAHNHNVEGPWNIDTIVGQYLKDGVFYVKIPGNIREFTEQIARRVNIPASIDVVFANAGLTSPGGHPVSLYEHVLRDSRYRAVIGKVPPGWFNGRGYVLINDEADLQSKWDSIKEGKPDFLKVFLVHSEDASHYGLEIISHSRKGLDPILLPMVVKLAHREGLRVSAHVETAADFRLALSAGVDEINHVPGWFIESAAHAEQAVISDDDARLAAKKGVVVVTTTVAMKPGLHASSLSHHAERAGHDAMSQHSHGLSMDASAWTLARDVQARNLRTLHAHRVKIAVGSDHADTSLSEASNLHEMGLFDNLTLLRLWCETTPQAIFPQRAIGRLDEGYEASFLVLAGNPIERFESVTKIVFRMKQGYVLRSTE